MGTEGNPRDRAVRHSEADSHGGDHDHRIAQVESPMDGTTWDGAA